jgi:hypothetical protein
MDDDKTYAEIKKKFQKYGLFRKISNSNHEISMYVGELNHKLPDIYRELKQEEILPEFITYEVFVRACESGLEAAKMENMFGGFNFRRK